MNFKWIYNFSKQTTVQGLHLAGLPKVLVLERVFWLVMVTVATTGAVAISYSNWMRYLANPSVVSLHKDFRNWANPFPAVTGCFMDKVDKQKATKYIYKKWGTNPSKNTFDYYMDFINIVANISYANLKDFAKFANDDVLKDIDMLEIANEVHPPLSGTLVTFDAKHNTNWSLIMSELGMCFSVNSQFAGLFSMQKSHAINLDINSILRCHYLNGLCYARYDSDPQLPLKYYIHSYLDVVHATIGAPLVLHESEELEINYRMQETESSTALRMLTPSQRRCRFADEPLSNKFPIFSSSICFMECRYELALKLCGCRPFFYHTLGGKSCDISGFLCLAKHVQYITRPPLEIGCVCPQPCQIVTYLPQVPKLTKWEYGYFDQRITFRWGLLPPTTKFYRDVLFGFKDLLVSFGGTLALFLGISFISVIETLFLLGEIIMKTY